MNSGAPLGASRRSPSPEVAAMAGCIVIANATAAAHRPRRTVPELTALRPPRFGGVLQRVIDGLEREVRVGHAEPVVVLVALARISPLPEPHEADFQPWPLLRDAVERAYGVACLQRQGDPPELLDSEGWRVDIPAHLSRPDRRGAVTVALHHLTEIGRA